MHEYGIAYDLCATARKAALDNNATRVTRVSVEIGEMAMVNPEQLGFLFDVICGEDALLKGAVLQSEVVVPQTRCECGYEGAERFVCPRCGALPEVVRGREIFVRNVEIEVDDP
jgi:hydrogenase nickel incorporation protein HypA/HybF